MTLRVRKDEKNHSLGATIVLMLASSPDRQCVILNSSILGCGGLQGVHGLDKPITPFPILPGFSAFWCVAGGGSRLRRGHGSKVSIEYGYATAAQFFMSGAHPTSSAVFNLAPFEKTYARAGDSPTSLERLYLHRRRTTTSSQQRPTSERAPLPSFARQDTTLAHL